MVWYNILLCFGIGIVHFFSTTIEDCGDAVKNVKQVFVSSECESKEKNVEESSEKSNDKTNEKFENKKSEQSSANKAKKAFSLTKKVSKAIKSVGSAGVDIALDVSFAGCQEFRKTPLGKIVSLLDCNPDEYGLFPQN